MNRFGPLWEAVDDKHVVAMDETSLYLGLKDKVQTIEHRGAHKVIIPVSGYDSVRYLVPNS